MGILLIVLGYFLLGTSSFIWAGHGIYELIKTDQTFWTVLLSNGSFWLLQIFVGFIILVVGVATKE